MDFEDVPVSSDVHDGVTPDLDELQQQEPEAPALDVDVVGPVQTHSLPARTSIMHNVRIGTTATQILGRDMRRGRLLIWPASVSFDSVSSYDSGDVDADSTAGDVIASLASSELPAGRYQIDVRAYMSDGTTPDVLDALQVAIGSVNHRLMSYNAVNNSTAYDQRQPFTVFATLDGSTDVAVTVAAPETSTNVETFNVTITATRLGSVPYFLGSRSDEVQAETAALVTHPDPIELKHCDSIWVKASAGSVELSFISEQWAD